MSGDRSLAIGHRAINELLNDISGYRDEPAWLPRLIPALVEAVLEVASVADEHRREYDGEELLYFLFESSLLDFVLRGDVPPDVAAHTASFLSYAFASGTDDARDAIVLAFAQRVSRERQSAHAPRAQAIWSALSPELVGAYEHYRRRS